MKAFLNIRSDKKLIELQNVSKTFDTGDQKITAVDDVSINIDKGEIYGIVGYSGAGKSTLVRTLNGLEKPTSGNVLLEDNNLSSLSGKDLRKERQNIGMIFQHFNILWSRTVRENIMFPLEISGVSKSDRIKRADELIEMVDLDGRGDAYPAQLSGGQKQRVGIARALANNPKVLLCDEATSSLDPKTTDDVLDLLLDINKKLNLTVVMITHEMEVIRKICNRVAVMDAGKVVEEGQVDEVFQRPQQEITKRFIRQEESEDINELIDEFIETYPEGKILRVTFQGLTAQSPIISQVSRKYDVDINIIHGSIYSTKASSIGTLYVQIVGKKDLVDQAVNDLNELDIEVVHDGI